jgi:hypothetical protein
VTTADPFPELEYSALQEVSRPDIQASELSIQHMKDVNHQAGPDSPLIHAISYMLRVLCQQYAGAPGYVSVVKELLDRAESGYITLRRLELELMHAGRVCLLPIYSHLRALTDCYRHTYLGKYSLATTSRRYGRKSTHYMYKRLRSLRHGLATTNKVSN